MPVDNDLYNRMPTAWWDEHGFLNFLRTGVNPARFGYFHSVLVDRLGIEPSGKRALDIGCGGGLLAEEFAQLGCQVTGIDPAPAAIEVAKAHAEGAGLTIEYRVAAGEQIPYDDESFDIVYCCDVLEHVNDLDKVMAETARVLKPEGIYFYDTINRTMQSKLILIKLAQDWKWTRLAPPNLHDWKMFIKPHELHDLMFRYGIENRESVGISSGVSAIQLMRTILKLKRGEITYGEFGRRAGLQASRSTAVAYMGYGIKSPPTK